METKNRNFKMISLFDGSGGFPLASSLCGIEPVACSEIEPFPIKVTRARFPNMKHLGDISTINGAELEPVDLITGGSPCQDMSVAGKRQGMSKKCPKCDYSIIGNEEIKQCPNCDTELEYTRSGLFMEQIRIIKEMRAADEVRQNRGANEPIRPRFMLWENVCGAFSSNKGEDFRAVLEETARIADPSIIIPRPNKGKWNNAGCIVGNGFSIAWRVLDAQYWGVPQRRKRIALVSDFGGPCAGEILFKSEGLSRHIAKSMEAWQGTSRNIKTSIRKTSEQYSVDFGRTADRIQMNADKFVTLLGEGGGAGAKTGLYCLPKPYVMNERQYACTIGSDVANTLTGTDYKGTQCLFEPKPTYTIDGKMGNTYVWEEQANTLTARDYKAAQSVCIPIQDQAVNNGKGNGKGIGEEDSPMYSLTTNSQHAICHTDNKTYRMEAFGQYKEDNKASCLKSRDYKDSTDLIVDVEYIVRRLTPLECCRLQGFP